MHAKKLIYISHLRYPAERTHSTFAMKTCETLAREGFSVELWVPWRLNPRFRGVDPYEYHGVEHNFVIRRIPSLDAVFLPLGRFGFLVMVASFSFSTALYALWRARREQMIFYLHDVRDAVLLAGIAPLLFLEIHDFYRSAGWMNRWVFARLAGFVVTNRLKMDILRRDFGIADERMLLQPNAVDADFFSPDISRADARRRLVLPQDRTLICYTGHLFSWKGVETLVASAAFLREDEVIYVIGDGKEKEHLMRQSAEWPDKVVFAGIRAHAEIPLWLRAADVLVLPNTARDPASKYETSPVKLYEYMASGTPIVASDLPSVREIVREEHVWFFEPDDAESLAGAAHTALGAPLESEEKSSRAKESARGHTWHARAHAIGNFIRARASA